jgi:hypothetical protein
MSIRRTTEVNAIAGCSVPGLPAKRRYEKMSMCEPHMPSEHPPEVPLFGYDFGVEPQFRE